VIEQAAKAITEGRDAVQGLRASTVESNDLAVAIRTLGDELATDPSTERPPVFRVAVEGQARDLYPIVRDDITRLRRKHFEMSSDTPLRTGWSRSTMTTGNSDCARDDRKS
jgi:hypothetical protein